MMMMMMMMMMNTVEPCGSQVSQMFPLREKLHPMKFTLVVWAYAWQPEMCHTYFSSECCIMLNY